MSLFGETEARYAALAGLVQDARVLDLTEHGDGRCIDALITAGARSITVCAADSVREQLTTQSADLNLTPPIDLPLQFAAASFDVVICFDLVSRIVRNSNWVAELREVLEPEGAIVISSVSAEEAARVLGPTFGVATVFAQSPLVGHMLYDTEVEELEPELDRTWADGDTDEPTRYMLVLAPDKRHTEKLTLVQMPFGKWEESARAELTQVKHERDAAVHELNLLREQMATNQWQQESAGGELEATRAELQNARHEIELLVSEVSNMHAAAETQQATESSSALTEELERHRNDRTSLEAQIADLLHESAAFSEHRLDWQARFDAVEGELVAERTRVAELTAQTVSSAAGSAELEERLGQEATRAIGLDQEIAAERLRAHELEAALAAEQARSRDLDERLRTFQAEAADPDEIDRARGERDAALADLHDAIRARDQASERADQLASARDTADHRAGELHHERDATEELLSRARLETVDAVEALRQERVRGEQLLTRLVDLEQRLAPDAQKAKEESPLKDDSQPDSDVGDKTVVTHDALPPGGEATDGES